MEVFSKKDLVEFITGKIAVKCKTKALSDEFIKWCYEMFIIYEDDEIFEYWNEFQSSTTYFIKNEKFVYCNESFINPQIKKFEGFKNKEDKMDNLLGKEIEFELYGKKVKATINEVVEEKEKS